MNNLKFLLTLAVLVLCASCSSSDDGPAQPQTNADVVFMSGGGTKNMEVGTNWTIDNPDEYTWCTATIDGSKLELTALANTNSESRRAIYRLSQGNASKKVEVLQYPAAEVRLSERPKAVSKNGGDISIAVTSNVPFEVSIPEKDQSWVRCTVSRSATVHFVVSPNTDASSRSTTVSLVDADGNILLTFAISQKGDQAPNVIYYTTTNGSKIIARGGFGGNFNILSHTYLDGQGTIVFDGNIFEIETSAFANSSNLVSMSLPDGITGIGAEAFANCTNLEEINIPETTKSIGVGAFKGCTSLKTLSVPENCQLNDQTFENSGLESFIYPNQSVVHGRIFRHCRNLKSVQLPEGIVAIWDDAFYGCTELRTVNIPVSLVQVYSYAFYNCTSLESLSFGPNVLFESGCFDGMTGRIRLYPAPERGLRMLNGFKGTYEFPEDANPEYLLSCSHDLEKEVRFAGKYASADGRCLVVDGKLYAAMLRDYDKVQYNFPKGIVKVMDDAVILKAFDKRNSTNIAFLFFADGIEEMGGRALYTLSNDITGIYSRATYTTVFFPKSFKRFTGDEVIYSNIGWYVVFESQVPPELGTYRLFHSNYNNYKESCCKILVPADAVDAYRAAWPQEASVIIAGSIDDFVMWKPYE